MTDKRPGRGSDQFPLRLPDGMRERIRQAAERSGRSMNAEIISMLEIAFVMDEQMEKEAEYAKAHPHPPHGGQKVADAVAVASGFEEMAKEITDLRAENAKMLDLLRKIDKALKGDPAK